MQQHITVEQLNELSDKSKNKILKFVLEKNGLYHESISLGAYIDEKVVHYVNIGRMIEFLGDEYIDYLIEYDGENGALDCDVCDCLWEAVKEVLDE